MFATNNVMEIFDIPHKDSLSKEQIEFAQKKQHELKFIGRQRRIAGLTLFSYNIDTGEIKTAPTEDKVAIDSRTLRPIDEHKLVIEKRCIYRQALNKKNFIKRLLREGVRIKNFADKHQ